MSIEINLATYDKQNEILRKLNEGGGEGYFYLLASADSTAMPTDIEALKGLKNIKSIVNSEAAMEAVANSSTAMEAVANSSTAMEAVLNSSTAMEVVGANSMATAKIVAKLAGLNTSDYANMEAVANSSTAMEAVANSSTAMEAVANSSTAMEAVANSSTAMKAVINSSTAMEALLTSENTKILSVKEIISGKFLPLKADYDGKNFQAYNGSWSNIGTELGGWLKNNANNPIATQIKHESSSAYYNITYYDLNA